MEVGCSPRYLQRNTIELTAFSDSCFNCPPEATKMERCENSCDGFLTQSGDLQLVHLCFQPVSVYLRWLGFITPSSKSLECNAACGNCCCKRLPILVLQRGRDFKLLSWLRQFMASVRAHAVRTFLGHGGQLEAQFAGGAIRPVIHKTIPTAFF
jgi:hypothetical protein